MLTCADRRLVHTFFHKKLGLHWSEDFRGVMYVPDEFTDAVMNPEHVAVGVAYNAFIGKTCCMHCVIQRPDLFSRAIVRNAFTYPFEHCGCLAVLALVDSTNDAALSLDTRLGFKHVLTVPHGGVDGDLCVLQMLRSECRWLKPH